MVPENLLCAVPENLRPPGRRRTHDGIGSDGAQESDASGGDAAPAATTRDPIRQSGRHSYRLAGHIVADVRYGIQIESYQIGSCPNREHGGESIGGIIIEGELISAYAGYAAELHSGQQPDSKFWEDEERA